MNIFLKIMVVLELVHLTYFSIKNKVLLFLCAIILGLLCLNLNSHIKNIIGIDNISLLTLIFVNIIILRQVYNNLKLTSKYNNSKKYIAEYEKIIDEQGKRNHEYNNQLMILKGYINDKKKLKEYLDLIIEDQKICQNYEIRQLSNFPNDGLKEMLYYKISRIKDNNIKYYLYVSSSATELLGRITAKKYKEITKVFGVLIDNAIDAALVSNEKEISLDFSRDDEYIIITVSNSYDKNTDLKRIGKKGFSSKGKGHGFGLKLVKEIIKKNKNLELITEYDEKYFNQTFFIDTKK